jgi:hypothetical protein
VIQLVTPFMVSTSIGAITGFDGFGILNLHFVPEADVVGLAVAGLRRRRV